jgi:hypothetical protein
MQHLFNLRLCRWLLVRRQNIELNACSQGQWKEASEGAEQNLTQRYLNIFLSCVLLLEFSAKRRFGQKLSFTCS